MEQASAPSPDAPDARERILRAASELIASDGIDEVRIARVANRARASTALVHHYFSTREELLAQALLQSFELAADERFGAGPAAAGSATEGLAIAIDECLPTPGEGEREWVLWVELWLRATREPDLRPVAGRMYESYGSGWPASSAAEWRAVSSARWTRTRSPTWRWRCSTGSAFAP